MADRTNLQVTQSGLPPPLAQRAQSSGLPWQGVVSLYRQIAAKYGPVAADEITTWVLDALGQRPNPGPAIGLAHEGG